ncbi:MAG: hypothetical protein V4722_14735 [Bacteroidota bacterium]
MTETPILQKNYKLHFVITCILLLVVAIVPFFIYRKQVREKDEVLKICQVNLERSNGFIKMKTEQIVSGIVRKAKDPEMADKAAIWQPYIQQADFIFARMQPILTASLVKKTIHQKERKELMDSLRSICRQLTETIPTDLRKRLPRLFLHQLPENNIASDGKVYDEEILLQINDSQWKIVLLNLYNDLLGAKHTIVQFCDEQVQSNFCGYDKFEPLIFQNTTALQPGQTLEIRAGIGAFSSGSFPEIFANGTALELNDSGYARYKKIVTARDPGKILIMVRYHDRWSGQLVSKETMIRYKVLKP